MKASELRAKALARQSARKPVSAGSFEGVEYFVRPATVRERADILKRGGIAPGAGGEAEVKDLAAFQVAAVVKLSCDAEGAALFTDADFDALLSETVGGIVDFLAPAATAQINVSPTEASKN